MTQYAAGPLFCFVDNQFMTEEALHCLDPLQWAENECQKDTAWQTALERIPTAASMLDY